MTTLPRLDQLLPENGIPVQPGGIPPLMQGIPLKLHWYGTHQPENDGNSAEPLISYELNQHGYRCSDWGTPAQIRVASLGCSCVFGVGLRPDELFHEIFCEHLRQRLQVEVVNWNLGVSGVSNEALTRIADCAVRTLNPHIILVLFTHSARREFATSEGEVLTFNAHQRSKVRRRNIFRSLGGLMSDYDDTLNFYRSYCGLEAIMTGRRWLFAVLDSDIPDPMRSHIMGQEHFAGRLLTKDRARDRKHPGPLSHLDLAERFISAWERMRQFDYSSGSSTPFTVK